MKLSQLIKRSLSRIIALPLTTLSLSALAGTPNVGDAAPVFQCKTHENVDFDLNSRKGKWTVLYFYPKADTPGCTKQACAFRDSIEVIRKEGAEVFGISTDNVKAQSDFHKKYSLNFSLLADSEGKISDLYGSRIPLLKISKRWTFIIDPDLKVRSVEKDVDPAQDSKRVADIIAKLKSKI